MKMKSFALLAMPVLLTATFASIAPVFADDSIDAMNNTMLAENDTQNQGNMDNNNNNNSMGNPSNNNSMNNNSTNNSNNDEGSPDTAPSTGDDDY